MAQITNVTSEALQAQIRRLLPSQQGFGEDLQAQNVIVPIVDLTETAEGSVLRADLQTASCLTNTSFSVQNTTTTVLTGNTGFFQFHYTFYGIRSPSNDVDCRISITDGVTTTILRRLFVQQGSVVIQGKTEGDLVVYLNAGDSITVSAIGTLDNAVGSFRQIATKQGVLVNPTGFTSE